jgi:UDP-glucose 4-epimerase
MRILVTGGSGYIGFHVIALALKNGHSVVSVDTAPPSKFEGNYQFIQGSILNFDVLSEVSRANKFDAIVHLAAEKSIEKSNLFPEVFVTTNVLGTKVLADFALREKIKHFVFASTAAVYGEVNVGVKLSENCELNPSNTYGTTKVQSEHQLQATFANTHTRLSILRLFNIAGAAHNYLPFNYDVNIFPQLIKSIHEARPFNLYGKKLSTKDGSAVRDYVHVEDVARIFLSVLHKETANRDCCVVNVCSGVETSNIEVIQSLEAVSSKSVLLSIMPQRRGEIAYVVGDAKRLMSHVPTFKFASLEEIATSSWLAHARLKIGDELG